MAKSIKQLKSEQRNLAIKFNKIPIANVDIEDVKQFRKDFNRIEKEIIETYKYGK